MVEARTDPAPDAAPPSVVRARWGVLPAGGRAERIEVAIADGRIAWVGSDGAARPDDLARAETVDLGEATLLPGLVDSHVHLTFPGGSDPVGTMQRESVAAAAARAAGNAQRALDAGVTTLVDCGDAGGAVMAVRDAIEAGLLRGPRLLSAGSPVTTTGGHCHWLGGTADSAHEAVVLARTQCAAGADLVKVMLTGGNMTPGSNPGAPQYEDEVLERLAAESRRLQRPLVVHAHSEGAVRSAALAGATVIAHASCQEGDRVVLSDETVAALAAAGTAIDATITVGSRPDPGHPGSLARAELRSRMLPLFLRLFREGVPILAGTDAGVRGVGFRDAPRAILQLHRDVGMPWRAALAAGTAVPARVLGLPAGELRAGLSADLLAVDGELDAEPERLLAAPLGVWVRGERLR